MLKVLLSMLFLVISAGCAHQKTQPYFSWPLKKPTPISRKFSIYHDGLDFPKNTGTPVTAIQDGIVFYAGAQFSGYGKLVVIKHDSHWSSLYAHLHRISVKQGDRISKGGLVGLVGNTGRSSGPHLHFELIYDKQPINPMRYMPH